MAFCFVLAPRRHRDSVTLQCQIENCYGNDVRPVSNTNVAMVTVAEERPGSRCNGNLVDSFLVEPGTERLEIVDEILNRHK